MSYKIDHIPKTTPCNRRPGHKMSATTLTIHNTGNPTSTAAGERKNLTRVDNTRTASFHIVIDERQAIECLPLNESAWHCGDGSGQASGNRTSIGIEICESGDYAKTLDNAAELVAGMLKERGWGTDRLRRHYGWSGKNCPRLMNTDGKWSGWPVFKQIVAAKMQPKPKEDEPMTTAEKKAFEELQQAVKDQQKTIEAQAKEITSIKERTGAPVWFVEEFGSSDLGGLMNEPTMTKEGWRNQAFSLRTQGFGNGRGKSVDIK